MVIFMNHGEPFFDQNEAPDERKKSDLTLNFVYDLGRK